ncbi:hypothetical protein ABTE06_19890, partial [Acinetobacter baumannii]
APVKGLDRLKKLHEGGDNSIGFYLICVDETKNYYWQSDPKDERSRIEQFFDELQKVIELYHSFLTKEGAIEMNLTAEEEASFQKAKKCHICWLKI